MQSTIYSNFVVIKFSRFVDNLFGFTTLLTESKYYISVLRCVSLNDMVYFSLHALFLQAVTYFSAVGPVLSKQLYASWITSVQIGEILRKFK